MRAENWAATPMGPVEDWPPALRAAALLVLDLPLPAALVCGDGLATLPNDAFLPFLDAGADGLGASLAGLWRDAWPDIGPAVRRALAGEPVRIGDHPLAADRGAGSGRVRVSLSFSPVRGDPGDRPGVIVILAETAPPSALPEERDAFLLRLTDALQAEPDAGGVVACALRLLSERMPQDRCAVLSRPPGGDVATVAHQAGNGRVPALPGRLPLSGLAGMAEGRDGTSLAGAPAVHAVVEPPPHRDADGLTWSMLVLSAAPRRPDPAEAALVAEVARRTWAAMDRARARSALGERESRFRSLFDSVDEAVMVTEPAPERPDGLRDWRCVAMNRRAQALFGKPDLTGRSIRDAFPAEGEDWYDICDHVFATGEQTRFERATASPEMVLEIFVTRVDTASGARNLLVVMQDVTDRRRMTDALRRNEERQAFLLKLSDALRPLSDPAQIRLTASQVLGRHLGAYRVAYAEDAGDGRFFEVAAQYCADAPPRPGRFRYGDFGPGILAELQSGRDRVRPDVSRDARLDDAQRQAYADLGIGASLDVPLVKDGRLVAFLGVGHAHAHDFTPDEIALVRDVAERTWAAIEQGRAETALRASEERFREFGDNSSDALWILDADTLRMEYLSPAFETIWGESRAAVMANLSRWSDLIHPEDRPVALQAMPRLLAGETFVAEYRIRRPDGEVRWIRDAGFPITENGVVKRGGGIAQDVTDLKRIEAALRDSEARLRRFAEASQDVLWIRDARTLQWQYVTPAFETVYGLPRREALAGDSYRNWLDLIVPEDRATAARNISSAQAGAQVAFEYRVRRPADGAIRWLRNTEFPIPNEAGTVTLIGGISHDLTELREAELRLQALIEGIPQLVWRAGAPGRWTWASPQWTAHTGQQQADSRDKGWLDPLHPDDRDRALRAWDRAAWDGRLEVEYRIRDHRTGAYRWFQTRAVPVRDEAGAIAEWLGTSTDINELRDLQARQDVLVAELQHRTRNLITVVSAISRQTLDEAVSVEDFRQRFDDRLAALSRVQGLLSHLSAGQRVGFGQLLRSELSAIGAPGGKVTLDGPEDVPLRSATVQTFSLALHELATNALKYGALASAGGHLDIRWRVTRGDDGSCRLWVDWRETGVRMAGAGNRPQGSGYGRVLIEHALPYQLDAATTYELTPDGVHCTIDVPVQAPGRKT